MNADDMRIVHLGNGLSFFYEFYSETVHYNISHYLVSPEELWKSVSSRSQYSFIKNSLMATDRLSARLKPEVSAKTTLAK